MDKKGHLGKSQVQLSFDMNPLSRKQKVQNNVFHLVDYNSIKQSTEDAIKFSVQKNKVSMPNNDGSQDEKLSGAEAWKLLLNQAKKLTW